MTTANRPPIAFVDDDPIFIEFWINAVKGYGHATKYFQTPEECSEAIRRGEQFALFVIDLMMPQGSYGSELTRDGILTGVFLAKDIRIHETHSPIIILTNMAIESITDEVIELVRTEYNILLVRKAEWPPAEFARVIDEIRKGKDASFAKRGILARLWDSLILEPKLYGLGIDIKKLRGR